jgi:hypothetical protein
MGRRAFLSYARADVDRVAAIERRLRQMDYEVWIDRELKGGQSWWDEILAQIRSCDVFLAIVSPASLDSKACARERRYASALGKPLLPVAIAAASQAVPSELTRVQMVDYSTPGEDAAFTLVSALAATPPAPPLPEALPAEPEVPLSYLAAFVDMASDPEPLTRSQQLDILNDLEPGLRAADLDEREGAWHVLALLEGRPDLYADTQRRIDRLRGAYRDQDPTAQAHSHGVADALEDSAVARPTTPPVVPRTETPPPVPAPPLEHAAPEPSAGPSEAGAEPAPSPPAAGNGLSISAMVLGFIAALVFPIVVGPVAVVLALIARHRRERLAIPALVVAVVGTVLGFILGYVLLAVSA